MNHTEAAHLTAVEKYLLDELPPTVRDEFEEHYFDCLECAADLTATAAFMATAKQEMGTTRKGTTRMGTARMGTVRMGTTRLGTAAPGTAPRERPLRPATRSRFARPWVAPLLSAAAALLVIIAYQNFVGLPRASDAQVLSEAPEVLPSLSLVGGAERGESAPTVTVQDGKPFLLSLDIPAEETATRYVCTLLGPHGEVVWRLEVPGPQAKDTISIRAPAARAPGTYSLTVRSASEGEPARSAYDLAQYRFTLNILK